MLSANKTLNWQTTNIWQSPPDSHLVVASQQKSVSQRQTEVEDDVEEEIVPDNFVNAGLPSEQEFPEHTQACYCGHLGDKISISTDHPVLPL